MVQSSIQFNERTFVGVVAWAVSAEVVIGARRDSALKAADAIRLSQVRRFFIIHYVILHDSH